MSTERIEELISKEALEQFEQLRTRVNQNVEALEKLIVTGVQMDRTFAGSKTFVDFNNVLKQTEERQKAITAAVQKVVDSEEKLGATTKKIGDAWTQLNTQYKEALNNFRAVSAEFGTQDERAQKAARSVQ